MPDILINSLKEYYELQKEKSSQYNFNFVDKESFVFCNNDGEIRSYGGTKKIFYTFLKSHNLNKYHIHFHTLRPHFLILFLRLIKIRKLYKHYLDINQSKQQLQHTTQLTKVILTKQQKFLTNNIRPNNKRINMTLLTMMNSTGN